MPKELRSLINNVKFHQNYIIYFLTVCIIIFVRAENGMVKRVLKGAAQGMGGVCKNRIGGSTAPV